MHGATPTDQSWVRFRDAGICIALFLSALFVIITISNPGLYLNDEWITVNQVHQLDIGHQITINEGKYGVFKNGTPGGYFTLRHNVLLYSVALPLASMPAMKLIDLTGDNFRLALIILWVSLPFFIALVISLCYPEYARIGSIRITLLGAMAGFLLFAANLLMYFPFVYSAPDAPVEVAAVVFTDHLFFAFTVVMSYLIARQIFDGRWKALFAALTVAASSSFLFWGTNAKDHIATAAVFAVMLYFFVCYLRSRDFKDIACGFFFIGILAWIRPEVGFSAFFCLGLYFIAENLLRVRQKKETLRSGIISSSAILFTAIGAIPFFLNNFVVTGNPLKPVYLFNQNVQTGGAVAAGTVAPVSHVSNTVFTTIGNLISTLGQNVFSVSPNPLSDLYGIFFFPKSPGIGFFFIVPIALLALVLFPLIAIRKKKGKNSFTKNKEILLLLLVAAFSVLFAYIHYLDILNADGGSIPDIRYLSPMYLPVILMSLVLLETTILFARPKALVLRLCTLGIVLVPVLLLIIFMNPTHIASNSNYNTPFIVLISAEMIIIAAFTAWCHIAKRDNDAIADLLLPVLIVTVLAWQVMMIFLVSPAVKINGYPFWIPGIDALYNHIITVAPVP